MIFVTGGTGLTGAHLLYRLAQKEEKILALKRESSDTGMTAKIFSFYSEEPEKLLSKIEWVNGDILDIHSLLPHINKGDAVYHTAALVSFDPAEKTQIMETNVAGTANVVNACLEKKAGKLAYVSSVAALGRAGNNEMTTEESDWKADADRSPYAISKYEAEREVWRGTAEGLKAVIVNPSIILGPGDFSKGSLKMFRTVYNGLKVYTPGMNGYVDVNDVAEALIRLMESDITGERFLLNGANVSYKELFEMMARALGVDAPKYKAGRLLSEMSWRVLKIQALLTGKRPLITKQTARTANSIYRYSSQKIKKATGMQFTPIADTMERAASFFLQEKEH